LIPGIRPHNGQRVVLAVSPAGLVELARDSPRWEAVFGKDQDNQGAVLRPDLDKLDLSVKDFVSLDDLRASDSGRIVGPKAAKLGELRHHFPEAVAPGVAIPLGVFRQTTLDQPHGQSGQTVFEWMVRLPASGSDTVLQPAEIQRLVVFARELPQRFPPITNDAGNPAPADIEFGFLHGKLHLFQIRPFLENRQARGSGYLSQMDQALKGNLHRTVVMYEVPK
jgi:hypothetical protein